MWGCCRFDLSQRTKLARLTQNSARQHIQCHMDRPRREVLPHVVRVLVSEVSGNLFRRKSPGQMCPDIAPQPRIHECARLPPVPVPCRHDWAALAALLYKFLGSGLFAKGLTFGGRLRVSRSYLVAKPLKFGF